MKSAATFRKHSSAGTNWAAWVLGIGLGRRSGSFVKVTYSNKNIYFIYPQKVLYLWGTQLNMSVSAAKFQKWRLDSLNRHANIE